MTTLPIETARTASDQGYESMLPSERQKAPKTAASYSGALRLASEQEAEKLQAEAEANEQQAQADRAKAEAAQMREASFPHFLARDVSRKLDAISVSLIEDDYVFILDPQKKLDSRRLMKGLQEGVATELSERSVSRDNPGGDVINDKDIDLDVEWSEDIEDDTPGWEVRFSQGNRWASREASGGLYGYTKGTQRDVEASVRKAQRRAASVAKTLYAKDQRTFAFLKSHAKRANSKTARLILSAMSSIGPRVASDKTAGSGDRNKAYLDSISSRMKDKILKGIANHYGTTVAVIEGEVTDKDAEALYEYITDRSRMQVYRDMQAGRFASTKVSSLGIEAVQPNLFYISTSDGDTYGPFRREPEAENAIDDLMVLDDTFEAVAEKGDKVLKSIINPRMFQLYTPADLTRQYRTASLLPVEKAAAGDAEESVREKVAGGLYGYPTKTARMALVACSDLRAYVGEVAYGLHSRRTAKYDRITGFLKEHGKTAKCSYSRMILSCYPDGPSSKSAAWPSQSVGAFVSKVDSARSDAGLSMSDEDENEEMLKKAFVPDSVDGWLEWADGTRTATTRRRG
jgi:hypothetical protein